MQGSEFLDMLIKFFGYHFLLSIIFFVSIVNAGTNRELVSDLQLTFPKEIRHAPNFNSTLLNGNKISLSDYKGKLVLLNFWSINCAPCREEMPALQTLWDKFKVQGLVILAISVDRSSPKIVEQYIQNAELTFPVVLDSNSKIRKQYEVSALPMTYIIGRDGKFIAKAIGLRRWSSTASYLFFKKLLQE